jgi:hypothetical protein
MIYEEIFFFNFTRHEYILIQTHSQIMPQNSFRNNELQSLL